MIYIVFVRWPGNGEPIIMNIWPRETLGHGSQTGVLLTPQPVFQITYCVAVARDRGLWTTTTTAASRRGRGSNARCAAASGRERRGASRPLSLRHHHAQGSAEKKPVGKMVLCWKAGCLVGRMFIVSAPVASKLLTRWGLGKGGTPLRIVKTTPEEILNGAAGLQSQHR
eukprot:gene15273-biopygen3665